MKTFWADLHIHSALSPCAADEMTPRAVVREALGRGLSMIAICDHNSALNVPAFLSVSKNQLTIIPGIEITTSEEVHVVGLFPNEHQALAASRKVRDGLPDLIPGLNREGSQTQFDSSGDPTGEERKNLSASSGIDLVSAIQLIKRHCGLAIAAHIDRASFGLLGQLGFFPAGVVFDAVEVTAYLSRSPFAKPISELNFPVYRSSDSHFLDDIGTSKTKFSLAAPTFYELALAFCGASDRGIVDA